MMAEQPETPKILDEISKKTNAKSGAGSRKQQTARRRIMLILILLLPILCGLLYVAYLQFAMQQELASLRSENSQLTAALNSQDSRLENLRQEISAVPEQVEVDDTAAREMTQQVSEELQAQLQQEVSRLTAQLNRLASRQAESTDNNEQQWKILEAEYLAGLALRKVQIERDIDSAIALLQQADRALLDSRSPAVLSAREALAADITALQAVEVLDREGIYLRLQTLAGQIAQVDMVGSMRENFEARRNRESTEIDTTGQSGGLLDSSLQFLGSIFVWRHWEEDPAAMLAPGNETAILQRLQLTIEQAKLALLSANNELYQGSLADCLAWLERYAVVESELGQTVIAEVSVLQQIDVDPELPAPTGSLASMQQLTAELR
jgi:uroporphyrin-3 C-methyltransferase